MSHGGKRPKAQAAASAGIPQTGRSPGSPALRIRRPPFASHWGLDPEVIFLNHGSFGACPRFVLERQQELRARMEREPILFLHREIESLLDASRSELAGFLGADLEGLAFVPNATTAINAVLRSLEFRAGDEILVTDHEYNATRNVIDFVADRTGARVRVIPVPFPLGSADTVLEAVLDRITARTRLLVIDHVTSPTGLVLPLPEILRGVADASAGRGDGRLEILVDGAHAPGMVPLNLLELGVDYYVGNCHKWICAPKGAGFLHVRADRRDGIRPAVISHGANSTRTDLPRFRLEFDWTGTDDPTPFLGVGEAIRHLGGLIPGGWSEIRSRNRDLALAGRRILCQSLETAAPAPEEMVGSMAAVPLPDGSAAPLQPPLFLDPLQVALYERYRIEVPVIHWPKSPRRLVRISAQLYNCEEEYQLLADALRRLLAEEPVRP